MSETAAPQAPPAEAPAPSFVDFIDGAISTALKENPRMPALNKDLPPGSTPEAPAQPETRKVEPAVELPETTPEQATKALLPDFSKLAFGQQVEKVSPEQKKEQPTPATTEEFPEKFPGSATPQAQDTWAKMRTSVQSLWKQNADLNSKLKEAEERLKEFDGKTPMASDEFDRITTERDDLVKELRLVKLEATPEYKKAVSRPMELIEDEVKRLGAKYSLSQLQIKNALSEPDPDKQADLLSKVTDTFNDRDKLNLFKLADDSKEIYRRRSILQKDVKQALDYIEAKRTADAERVKTEQTAEWTGTQKKAWKIIGDELYLARPLEGNDEWNRGLEDTKAIVARTDLDKLEPIDRAKVLVQAALLPRALMAIHQLWNMYQQASGALKRYQGVTPGAGSGASSGGEFNGQAAGSAEESGMSFIDAIERRISSGR